MKHFLSILFCSLLLTAFAQNEEVELSIHLKNDDILTGKSTLEKIVFKTDFGTLNFPIDQINSLEIGLTDSRFDKANLLSLLGDIENGGIKEKENAFDAIIKMDEGAIPFIKAYLNASNSIPNKEDKDISLQTLYEVMLAKHKVSRNYSLNDIVTYNNNFRVEGMYEFSKINLETDYGQITVERNDIARIDVKIVNRGVSNQNAFKLFANQNISGNKDEGWLNTGILVKKGDRINISSSGQIVLASLSGNTYSPDGGVNGSIGTESSKASYGQVVFKISQAGSETKAGDDFSGYASQTGILYLAIFESVYNSANAGYYTSKVKVN